MSDFSLNDEQINYILDYQDAKYHDLGWLWTALDSLEKNTKPLIKFDNFYKKKEVFFSLLEALIIDKKLKLAKNNIIVDENKIPNTLSEFRSIFPQSENEVEDIGGVQVWLMLNSNESCPFWPIWVDMDENGNEKLFWTD